MKNLLHIFSFIVIFCASLFKVSAAPDTPFLLNPGSNFGTEFIFSVPPCYEDYPDPFNFIMIYVASSDSAIINVKIGAIYDETKIVLPNDVAEFKLTPVQAQCFSFSPKLQKPIPEKIYKNNAIHVSSDKPVAVYCVVRYNMSSDGFLVYPLSGLGKEYIVSSYGDMGEMYNQYTPSTTTISACYDNTSVRFIMGGADLNSHTAAGLKPGDTATVILNKNDVWVFMSDGDLHFAPDLSGSKVLADKPIAVVSGNVCANVPINNKWCDYIVEMDVPVATWGKFYHVAISEIRKKSQIIRIYAKDPNTTIYKNGDSIAFLPASGGIKGKAYLEMRISEKPDEPAVFSGDKPIGISFYNPGTEEDSLLYNNDPFEMAISPVEQYRKDIIFCTPNAKGGKGFRDNYLNLIYNTDSLGFLPDDYELYSFIDKNVTRTKLNEAPFILDKPFTYEIYGKMYGMRIFKLPKDGVYRLRANSNFACYSYGFNDYDSYGYPTSISLADLNIPDFEKPRPSYQVLCRGAVVGNAVDYPDVDTLRSNLSYVYLNTRKSSNYDFKIIDEDKFIPGKTRKLNWTLTVKDTLKDAYATISFVDRLGNDSTIYISYKPLIAEISDNYVYVGNVKAGDSSFKQITLFNKSEYYPLKIEKLDFSKHTSGFSIIDYDKIVFPITIQPKSELKLKVLFSDTQSGNFVDTLEVANMSVSKNIECLKLNCVFKASVGVPVIQIDSVKFNSQDIDFPASTKKAYIYNSGSVPLSISGYKFKFNEKCFTYKGLLESDSLAVKPIVVSPGAYFEFEISFKPDNMIDYKELIEFTCDAAELNPNCYITGKGIKAILKINNLNFNRTFINRDKFPSKGSIDTLVIKNIGNVPVFITDLISNNINDLYSFSLQDTSIDFLNTVVIQAGYTYYVPIYFKPKRSGKFDIEVEFKNDAGISLVSKFQGIGTAPYINANSVGFPNRIIGDSPCSANEDSTIRVTNIAKDEFTDTLTVFGLNHDLGISPESGKFGSLGFGYDNKSIVNQSNVNVSFPIMLAPNEYFEFKPLFKPQIRGINIDSIQIISNGATYDTLARTSIPQSVDTAVSIWRANSLYQGLQAKFNLKPICFTGIDSSFVVISNDGDTPLIIKDLSVVPNDNEVKFPNFSQFTLPVRDSAKISLIYSPSKPINKNYKLIVSNNSLTKPNIEFDFATKAIEYISKCKSSVDKAEVSIAESFNYSLNIISSATPLMIDNNTLKVNIIYNPAFISADLNNIEINPVILAHLKNTVKAALFKSAENEVLEFTLNCDTNLLNNSDLNICKVKFNVYLPNVINDSVLKAIQDRTVKISASIKSDNECMKIEPENDAYVYIAKTCVGDLRNVKVSDEIFELYETTPNPVSSNYADINFSIAFDCPVTIKLYDSQMRIVETIFDDKIKKGKYSIKLSTQDLSSGVYFYEVNAGTYCKFKELRLIK